MSTVTQKVAIKNARFFAPIGFYKEERILGNEFFVDAIVSFPFNNPDAEQLSNTVNYEAIYTIINVAFGRERKLLESAVQEILEQIISTYSYIETVHVCVRKANPPFGGDRSFSEVSLNYTR